MAGRNRKQQKEQKKRLSARVDRDKTLKNLELPVEKTSNVKAGADAADAQKQRTERWKIIYP